MSQERVPPHRPREAGALLPANPGDDPWVGQLSIAAEQWLQDAKAPLDPHRDATFLNYLAVAAIMRFRMEEDHVAAHDSGRLEAVRSNHARLALQLRRLMESASRGERITEQLQAFLASLLELLVPLSGPGQAGLGGPWNPGPSA